MRKTREWKKICVSWGCKCVQIFERKRSFYLARFDLIKNSFVTGSHTVYCIVFNIISNNNFNFVFTMPTLYWKASRTFFTTTTAFPVLLRSLICVPTGQGQGKHFYVCFLLWFCFLPSIHLRVCVCFVLGVCSFGGGKTGCISF